MKQRLVKLFSNFSTFMSTFNGRRSHRDKQVFCPLVQTYHKIGKSRISKGCSSTLRTKCSLKIQNPIRFKDFMVRKQIEYRFTKKQIFGVFFARQLLFDPFFEEEMLMNTVSFMFLLSVR